MVALLGRSLGAGKQLGMLSESAATHLSISLSLSFSASEAFTGRKDCA